MIGKHAMGRLGLSATVAVGNGLTPAACPSYDLCTPCSELRCGVERIARLEPLRKGRSRRRRLDRAGVFDTDQRGKGTELRHHQPLLHCTKTRCLPPVTR